MIVSRMAFYELLFTSEGGRVLPIQRISNRNPYWAIIRADTESTESLLYSLGQYPLEIISFEEILALTSPPHPPVSIER